jgi:hypothetical protein
MVPKGIRTDPKAMASATLIRRQPESRRRTLTSRVGVRREGRTPSPGPKARRGRLNRRGSENPGGREGVGGNPGPSHRRGIPSSHRQVSWLAIHPRPVPFPGFPSGMPTGFVLAYSGGAAADSHRFPYFPALPFAYERSWFERQSSTRSRGGVKERGELSRGGALDYAAADLAPTQTEPPFLVAQQAHARV